MFAVIVSRKAGFNHPDLSKIYTTMKHMKIKALGFHFFMVFMVFMVC